MITAKNLTKKYGDVSVLNGVDFKLGNGKKIGLVGRNGCGKSTLFRIINHVEEPTAGGIDVQNEVAGYIPQEFDFPNITVADYLESSLDGSWEYYLIDKLVEKLEFNNYEPTQKLPTLSEGQKMKVKLIEVLLKNPTTLFIDEPTNHLDIEGIMWFENYVKSLKATVIMISHDRSFLNHTVDEIWEIEAGKLYQFVGDYDNYRTQKLKLIDKWNEEYVRFLRKKAQLEELLAHARQIKDGKARSGAVGSAKKRMEREVTSKPKEEYISKKIKGLNFATDIRPGKLMVRCSNVAKSYGKNQVFTNLDFELRGQEKLWLFGPNGAGKTTLVKMIMGDEPTTAGEVKVGDNVKIGYFAQVQNAIREGEDTRNIQEIFTASTNCFYYDAKGYLKRFLFTEDDLAKRIWQLSPGERARFAFAIFAHKDYDLLILDEPDNHLDIETKEVIEDSLRKYQGTLLLVSHDRYFVESVGVNKVLNLKDGALSYFENESS